METAALGGTGMTGMAPAWSPEGGQEATIGSMGTRQEAGWTRCVPNLRPPDSAPPQQGAAVKSTAALALNQIGSLMTGLVSGEGLP